jgi:hypothetical protein
VIVVQEGADWKFGGGCPKERPYQKDGDLVVKRGASLEPMSETEKVSKMKEFILYDKKSGRPPPVPPAPSWFWSSPIAFQVYLVIAIAILSRDPRFFKGMSIILLLRLVKVSLQWANFVYRSATHDMTKSIFKPLPFHLGSLPFSKE